MESSGQPKLEIYLCRHGETEWTVSGQHTGSTDLSLTKTGVQQALLLRKKLQKIHWASIYSSPMKRSLETCQLAQLNQSPKIDPRLKEWNYGDYEGKSTAQIVKINPSWILFQQGAPNGESPNQISDRADDLLSTLRKESGPILLFSHGHFLRALAARWLSLPVESGKLFALSVASISILSFERSQPVLKLWNEI